jgi:hypothetical protein
MANQSTKQPANNLSRTLQNLDLQSSSVDTISIEYHLNSTLGDFPNTSTIDMISSKSTQACTQHKKPMEAFCWTDMKAICIDCLLSSQVHKNHEILNLEKSIEK